MDKRIRSLALLALVVACSSEPKVEVVQGYALGTTYSIQYQELDAEKESIQQGIDSLFDVVNRSMSTYIEDSDISKINRGDSLLQVDEHFKLVFDKANLLWYKTQGYFDPTVGAWVNAYGFGPDKALKEITPAQHDSLMGITGWARIQMIPRSKNSKRSPEHLSRFQCHCQRLYGRFNWKLLNTKRQPKPFGGNWRRSTSKRAKSKKW